MKLKVWIKALRLRTLPLALSGIILAGFLSYHEEMNWFVFGLAISTTILLQILSNLANDYGDFKKGTDDENRVGPERALQSGVIGEKQMKSALIINVTLCFLTGVPLVLIALGDIDWISLLFIVLGISGVAAAIKYTVGKKAFGYSGLGDLFVFLFFGLVSIIGTYFLLTREFKYEIIFAAVAIGLFSVAVLNLNNLRDHVNDKNHGKNTLVVKMGFEKAKIYHYLLCILPLVCTGIFSFLTGKTFVLISMIIAPILLFHLRKVAQCQNPKDLDPELKKIALTTLLYAVLFGLGTQM